MAAFLFRNRAVSGMAARQDEWRRRLSPLPECGRGLAGGFVGATDHDWLDLGLRQRLRIRASNLEHIPTSIAVYEDPRLVGFWLSTPLDQRVGQRLYRRELVAAFPAIFDDPPPGLVTRARMMARKFLPYTVQAMVSQNTRMQMGERGDPARTPAMVRLLTELADSFDQRPLLPRSFGDEARKLAADPLRRRWDDVMWASTAELYVRAGLFD